MIQRLCLVAFAALAVWQPRAAGVAETIRISLIRDRSAAPPAQYALGKVEAALSARGVRFEEAASPAQSHGNLLLVAGLPAAGGAAAEAAHALGVGVPAAAESLVIRAGEWHGKPMLLATGADDRGLMYALLEVADRIGWTKDASHPFSAVKDTVESPSVADRGVTIFTMQQQQFETRLHDENYWVRYFDTLARDRFNTFQVLFAYETDGYMCPAYPYFTAVEQFPGVHVEGLSDEQRDRNLADLRRLIRLAHQRGIKVTIGLWCHYWRFNSTWGTVDHSRPVPGKVTGLDESNLIPYTRAALAKFLRAVPDMDNLMLLMHAESGLKTSEMKDFWQSIYRVLKDNAPNLQYEIRAKGVSDDLIDYGLALGLKIRVNTKFWAEQVGLPFHPTHIQELNQFERRHSYSDMLKYPRNYLLHYTLWTSGTTRILLWGDPEYVRRFAGATHLGGAQGFDIMEPEATKMAGHPHDMKPFELLAPADRYYDYEFERYWHFFQVFGRLTYDPNTPPEEWDHEFGKRFGQDAGPVVEQALHRASQILPRIVAYCLPPDRFPTTRGWPERQREEDLPAYARAEPSDIAQFQSLGQAARDVVEGGNSAAIAPAATSAWFSAASADVLRLAAEAERKAGPNPGNEMRSTLVDLRILAHLALYHSRRIPAGLSYALYQRTHDLNALDDAIAGEKNAVEAWRNIVHAAGDVYNRDLMMGLAEFDLSGNWQDELVKLEAGLAALERERAAYRLEPRRVIGRYYFGAGVAPEGYHKVGSGHSSEFETSGSNLFTLRVPDGRYQLKLGIEDEKKSHGPMWIEVNGVEYSDIFTVPAGQNVEKTIETTAVNGRIKILFDNATSADWYGGTLTVTRVGPMIEHVPVRRIAPGQDLVLRATVEGVDPIAHVRVVYGSESRGFASQEMESAGPKLYRATLPSSKVFDGMSYFLEADDSAGRSTSWPAGGASHAVAVLVTGDGQPPVLRSTPVATAEAGHGLRIVAEVEDPSGVKSVRLRYRGLSQHQDYQTLPMLPTGQGHQYEASIPGEDISPNFDLMYFFEVMDNAGNGKIYPDLERETPYVVVKVESRP